MSVSTTDLLDGLQFFFFIGRVFNNFFFDLSEPVQVVSHFWQNIEKKNYNEIGNQIVALSKTEGLFVGYLCKIISHSNNLV